MTIGLATRSIGSYGGDSITNLTSVTINSAPWTALNANTSGAIPYSLLNNTAQTRFEVINGQNAAVPGFSDPPYVMRSEVQSPTKFAAGVLKVFSFGLLLRSGPIYPSPLAFLVLGQIHADDALGVSPSFSFNLLSDGVGGETLFFDRNYNTGSGQVFATIGSMPFSRNTHYNFQLEIIVSNGGPSGFLRVTVNGVVLATFNGPVGFFNAAANSSYPKFGIYGGGNGGNATATPLPGQNIVAFYDTVSFIDSAAFYVSPSGNDSNPGTIASPFLTWAHAVTAMTASPTIKTTYIRAGTNNTNTVAAGPNQSLIAYPGDPAFSQIVHITTPGTGPGASSSNVTIKNLAFTMTGSGGMIQPADECAGLKILGCKATCVGNQNFVQFFNPGDGLRIQGNTITSDTWNVAGALFPVNIIVNRPGTRNDWIINSNTINGGTFSIQAQNQFVPTPAWTNIHFDWNICAGFGDAASTIGNIGMSIVGGYSGSNANNTCTGNRLTGRTGIGTTLGMECLTAGCTWAANIITCTNGWALANCINSLFNGATYVGSGMPFSNDGTVVNPDVYTSATAALVEVRTNTINGTSRAGIWTPTNLSPAPHATGLPTNPPSAPYVPS